MRHRPVLDLPWEINFILTLVMAQSNQPLNEAKLRDWMNKGGLEIGICGCRPMFGRFQLEAMEEVEE
jgi:hypothetical protein